MEEKLTRLLKASSKLDLLNHHTFFPPLPSTNNSSFQVDANKPELDDDFSIKTIFEYQKKQQLQKITASQQSIETVIDQPLQESPDAITAYKRIISIQNAYLDSPHPHLLNAWRKNVFDLLVQKNLLLDDVKAKQEDINTKDKHIHLLKLESKSAKTQLSRMKVQLKVLDDEKKILEGQLKHIYKQLQNIGSKFDNFYKIMQQFDHFRTHVDKNLGILTTRLVEASNRIPIISQLNKTKTQTQTTASTTQINNLNTQISQTINERNQLLLRINSLLPKISHNNTLLLEYQDLNTKLKHERDEIRSLHELGIRDLNEKDQEIEGFRKRMEEMERQHTSEIHSLKQQLNQQSKQSIALVQKLKLLKGCNGGRKGKKKTCFSYESRNSNGGLIGFVDDSSKVERKEKKIGEKKEMADLERLKSLAERLLEDY